MHLFEHVTSCVTACFKPARQQHPFLTAIATFDHHVIKAVIRQSDCVTLTMGMCITALMYVYTNNTN